MLTLDEQYEELIVRMKSNPIDAIYGASAALYFGYSKEALRAWYTRKNGLNMGIPGDQLPTSKGTPFEFTGYIPAPGDTDFETVAREINARRYASTPFPTDYVTVEEINEFTQQILADHQQPIFARLVDYMDVFL